MNAAGERLVVRYFVGQLNLADMERIQEDAQIFTPAFCKRLRRELTKLVMEGRSP